MFMVGMGNYSIIKLFICHDNRDFFFGNNQNMYFSLTSNNQNQQLSCNNLDREIFNVFLPYNNSHAVPL